MVVTFVGDIGPQAAMTAPTINLGADLEVQTVVCTSASAQGTFKLTFGGQTTTNPLAWNAPADAVKTAFEALSSVTSATVTYSASAVADEACTTGGTNTMSITFTGDFGNQGDITASATTLGLGGVSEVQTLTSSPQRARSRCRSTVRPQ
jgi:phage tail sheath gpL-like